MYCSRPKTVLFLIGLAALAVGNIVASAQTAPSVVEIRQLNNEVLRMYGEPQLASSQSVEQRREGAEAIARRATVMSDLIEHDPALALSMAFSPELAADLATSFPEAASSVEQQGTWEGPAETWIMDYPDGSSRSVTRMKVGDDYLEVYFAGTTPASSCQTDQVLRVSGVRLGNKLAASSASLRQVARTATTGVLTSSATTALTCSTAGPQNTAVLLVTFPGLTPPSYTTLQSVHEAFFGTAGYSLDGYWREASYGKASATGNVFGWYTLSTSYTCATTDQMRAEAIAMASNAGVNLQNYTRLFMVVPDMGCGWSGASTIGCTSLSSPTGSFNASTSYVNWLEWGSGSGNNNAAQVIFHEGGHGLGLNHSRSRAFGVEAVGPLGTQGTYSEYGDGFTAMVNGAPGHYDAPHKAELLNWLSGSNYQVVQSSGTWTLAPLETPSSGLQALKIQRGTGNNAWIWIEYRQPIGYDSAYNNGNVWSNDLYSGAIIHYEDAYTTYEYTDLLDFSPKDNFEFYDPDLPVGQTWVDPYSNVSITVNSATPSGLTVTVNYGAAPCTHASPTVTMSPSNPSVSAGSSVPYTVSVTNHDSSGCPSSLFSLTSTQPAGWVGTFNTPSLLVNPGQSSSATLTESVPAGTAAGTYSVTASAAGNSYTGSGTANATVVAPSTLTDSTSTSASSYSVRQKVAVTAKVMNGSVAAAGASVTFTMTKSNGIKVTGIATTDSSGTASWSYKLGVKDPKGQYSVKNSAIWNSQQVTSNTATFTVQ